MPPPPVHPCLCCCRHRPSLATHCLPPAAHRTPPAARRCTPPHAATCRMLPHVATARHHTPTSSQGRGEGLLRVGDTGSCPTSSKSSSTPRRCACRASRTSSSPRAWGGRAWSCASRPGGCRHVHWTSRGSEYPARRQGLTRLRFVMREDVGVVRVRLGLDCDGALRA